MNSPFEALAEALSEALSEALPEALSEALSEAPPEVAGWRWSAAGDRPSHRKTRGVNREN